MRPLPRILRRKSVARCLGARRFPRRAIWKAAFPDELPAIRAAWHPFHPTTRLRNIFPSPTRPDFAGFDRTRQTRPAASFREHQINEAVDARRPMRLQDIGPLATMRKRLLLHPQIPQNL